MRKKKRGLHITHNDADAIGCALVASIYEKDIEFDTKFCSIGTQNKTLNDMLDFYNATGARPCKIIISDISLDDETCERLNTFCVDNNIPVIGFDHHITNKLNDKYSWFKVSTNLQLVNKNGYTMREYLSAAKIMYNYYNELKSHMRVSSKFEYLIDMISRYDTWTWKNYPLIDYYKNKYYDGYDEDVIAEISRFLGIDKTYNVLLSHYKKMFVTHILPNNFKFLYYTLLNKRDKSIECNMKYVKLVNNFDNSGKTVAIYVSSNDFSNAIANHVYSNYPDIDYVTILYVESNRIGFRSAEDKDDVSVLAKQYNGGGHPHASGATVSDDVMLNLLHMYYKSDISLEEINQTVS